MNIIEIIILGIVQGIGEFLPISSSAHLILFRDILGIGNDMSSSFELAFDVALHFGTLLAIVVFFFNDFLKIAINGLTKSYQKEGKLMWLIIVATIPAAIVGFLFEDYIDLFFRGNHLLIVLALIFVGIFIYFVDKKMPSNKEIKNITFKDGLLIGISQTFALIPGFSRSGITIAASRLLDINKEDAAKFSFYLSAPIVLGALLVTLLKDDSISIITSNLGVFILGIAVSFITGLICIKFLLNYLKNHSFKVFMWYRIILATIMLLLILF